MPQPKSSTRTARPKPAAKTTAGAAPKRGTASARTTAAKAAPAKAASARTTAAKKPTAAKAAPAKTASARATAAKKPAGRATAAKATPAKTTAAKSAGAKPSASVAKRKPPAAKSASRAKSAPAGGSRAAAEDTIAANVTAVREFLTRGVLLTAERLQETLDDAVSRGRLTSTDADDLVARLVSIGRSQAEEIRSELEQVRGEIEELLEQSPADVLNAGLRAGTQLTPDRVVRELDRVRRIVGIGPAFPVLAYDELSAAQVIERLEDLNSAQLRKVRDRERRTAKRKTVLDAIERALK